MKCKDAALKGQVLHVDFLSVNMDEEVEVDVPIHAVGEAIGVKEGGVLNPNSKYIKNKSEAR